MQKPGSWQNGVKGVLAAAVSTAAAKYPVKNAVYNKYGDRKVAIRVKTDNAYQIECWGAYQTFASTADGVTDANAALIDSTTGTATTAGGRVHYMSIAAMRHFLPIVKNTGADPSDITIEYHTYND